MSAAFDAYRSDYEAVVQRSIAFSGLEHDFFLRAKTDLLAGIIARHFGPEPPSLLDVGCGVGRMHDLLTSIARSVSGCDVSAEALERARHDHPRGDYRQSADSALPWGDGGFDVSLAVCVLHHVPPAARDALVGEMRRVTRTGGLVVVIEHNPWNPGTRLAVGRCPFDHDAILLDAKESRALLERAFLGQIESRHFLLLPSRAGWAARIDRAFRRFPIGAQHCTFGTA